MARSTSITPPAVLAGDQPTPAFAVVNRVTIAPFSSTVRRTGEVQANQGAGQMQKSLEQGSPPLVAPAEATTADWHSALTNREVQVLRLLVEGYSNP